MKITRITVVAFLLCCIALLSCCCSRSTSNSHQSASVSTYSTPSPVPSFEPRKALLGEWSCAATVFSKKHGLNSPTVYEFYEDGTLIHKFELQGAGVQKMVGNFSFMTDTKLRVKYEKDFPEKDFFLDMDFKSPDKVDIMEMENKEEVNTYERIKKQS